MRSSSASSPKRQVSICPCRCGQPGLNRLHWPPRGPGRRSGLGAQRSSQYRLGPEGDDGDLGRCREAVQKTGSGGDGPLQGLPAHTAGGVDGQDDGRGPRGERPDGGGATTASDEHLEVACIECHTKMGEGVAASGFAVDDYDSVMKGTDLGTVVIAGSSISSTLYMVVAGKTDPEIRMPPHHDEAWAAGRGAPLGDEEIEKLAAWIDQGAKNN